MMTPGWIEDDNRTNPWQDKLKMTFTMTMGGFRSGWSEDEERMTWQWCGTNLRWRLDESTITTGRVDDGGDNYSRLWRCSIAITIVMVTIMMVLDCNGSWWSWWCSITITLTVMITIMMVLNCDGSRMIVMVTISMVLDCNGSRSWWCSIAIILAVMVLSCDGAGSQWVKCVKNMHGQSANNAPYTLSVLA